MYFGMFDTLKPLLIGGKDSSVAASFILGWAVTVTAGLMSYPIGELLQSANTWAMSSNTTASLTLSERIATVKD